jgi:hypothetical protein
MKLDGVASLFVIGGLPGVMLIYGKKFRVRGWSNWHRHYIGAELAAVVNQIIGVRSATNARSCLWKPPSLKKIDTFPIRGRTAPFVIPAYSWRESSPARTEGRQLDEQRGTKD